MRVKWNRNLDGIRPLNTVPETEVLSNGKLEEENNCENKNSLNCSVNSNGEPQVVHNNVEIGPDKSNGTNSVSASMPCCESPSPSSASITSRRSDKSRARISSLFGLFKVRDKAPNDTNSEDCVSNVSELSNATIPSLISSSIAMRKSNYGSRDSILTCIPHESIGFEADTRRRRRANSLLARNSLRKSWQHLNIPTKVSVGSASYIISKDRLPVHLSHSPVVIRHNSLDKDSSITNKKCWSLSANESKDEQNQNQSVETQKTGSDSESAIDDEKEVDKQNVENNPLFVMQTDVQTLDRKTNCISGSDLNQKCSYGCDEVDDNKVQSVVNSYDSKQNLLNNSKIIFDPKSLKSQQKFKFDKIEANICNAVTKNVIQTESNDVNHNNTGPNNDSPEKQPIGAKVDRMSQTSPQLTANQKSDQMISSALEGTESIPQHNEGIDEKLSSNQAIDRYEQLIESPTPSDSSVPVSDTSSNIIKVKVKKDQLPESEMVYFSTHIMSSPSTVLTADIDHKCNNDEAIVLTFINDEPMSSRIVDKEMSDKSDIFVKSPPIQGILRVRNRDSNSDDSASNSLKKSDISGKSQKKVHFADSCLYSRSPSRGRSRAVKGRHYGSISTIRTIRVVPPVNEKKTALRRPIPTNTGSSLAAKRMTNTKVNSTSTVSSMKREVRTNQANDEKQQIQKLSQLCESKTKQLKTLGLDNNYMRLAFDSLSVVIQHLIEQFEPFENPKIKEALKKANTRCEQLKDNLDAKNVELNDMKMLYEDHINHLMKEREKNCSDLNVAKMSHESNMNKLKNIHKMEVQRIQDKHNKELQTSQENCTQLLNQIEVKNTLLSEMKQSRDALEVKAKQLEDNILNDKDKKFKYLSEKSKQMELEVESLKVVMDMKNEKIHSLERKMIETQEKINELPFAKESIRSLQQQIETLQITLDRKIHQYNQLTREHEDLKTEFEREMREKRRLSMKNEELTFHLNESYNGVNESVSGLSGSANFDHNSQRFKTPVSVRTLHNDETPVRPNRSISMNAGPIGGSTPYASTRKSHAKVNRSVSMLATHCTPSESARNISFICCPSSFPQIDNLSTEPTDEVFDSGTGFNDCHLISTSTKKSQKHIKAKHIERLSEETPPQCILDSGFEDIQGLNSLSK